jgi:hypothetical protein
MATILVLRLDRQSHPVPAGHQRTHQYSFVLDSQDACLSRPPPSPTSHYCPWHPTHLPPTLTESVGRPHHYTHNARRSLLSNYATLRSHLLSHPTLSSLSLSKHRHCLEAPSTPPVIHLSLRRPPRTSFHCLMANFYLSSIVPRRFRTLSLPVQRTD